MDELNAEQLQKLSMFLVLLNEATEATSVRIDGDGDLWVGDKFLDVKVVSDGDNYIAVINR